MKITIEGPLACGKTYVLNLIKPILEKHGYEVGKIESSSYPENSSINEPISESMIVKLPIGFEYVSYDGRFISEGQEVFQCPRCFNILKVPAMRNYQPNTICGCEMAYGNRIIMNSLGVHAPIGFKKRSSGRKD